MNERRRFSRAWLGVIALLGSLVAMELTLQGAAIATRALVSERGVSVGEGAVILCVGDSHTYGLPLPEPESYPSQLQVRLDEAYGDGTFRVVNLGIPSVNSGFVLNRLERQIAQFDPKLVIVWVGINNLWNAAEMQTGDEAAMVWRQRFQHSKLFRLASIVWYSSTGHQYEDEGRSGWFEGEAPPSGVARGRPQLPNPGPGLARDLVAMGELAATFDVPVVLMGYPLSSQQTISRSIEQAAGRLGAPFVPSAADYARARRAGHTVDELVDERAGPHPSALLYGFVVDSLMRELNPIFATWYDAPQRIADPGRS